MILSDAELVTLTRRVRRSAQARVLDELRVPYRRRPDGSLVVFRRDVDAPPASQPARRPQLRLEARR